MLDIIICLALTLAEQHAYLFLCIFCITVLVGSLLYAYVSKVDRLIIGSLAAWHLWALPGVEDGWRMTALLRGFDAERERECAFVWVCVLCLSVSFCTFLCGSKLGTLIPSRQSPSLLQQDVCHTVLIKRQQHAPLPLVLQLICSVQITNVYQRRQKTPPTISLCCSFFLSYSVFCSYLFMAHNIH